MFHMIAKQFSLPMIFYFFALRNRNHNKIIDSLQTAFNQI